MTRVLDPLAPSSLRTVADLWPALDLELPRREWFSWAQPGPNA
jgi:hypothetical protein